MSEERLEPIDLNVEETEIPVEEPKKKKSNIGSTLLIIVGLICMAISISGLYGIYKEYKEAEDIYNEAEENFVQYEPGNEAVTEIGSELGTELETEIAPPPVPWYQLATVDLVGLKQIFGVSYDEFFEELLKEERHFAKRQQTWYNKEKNVIWLDAKDDILNKATKIIEEFLNQN